MEAISAALSIASGDSSITTIRVSRLIISVVSLSGKDSNPSCGIAPVIDRCPIGGYRQLDTIWDAVSALSTWGITTP